MTNQQGGRALADLSADELCRLQADACACGKEHSLSCCRILLRQGALQDLPRALKELGIRRPFVFCDPNTYEAAGEAVRKRLTGSPFFERVAFFMLPERRPEAGEQTAGQVLMAFAPDCDGIVAVGSGTLNDLGKLLASRTGRPFAVVATAPSMDGYASGTSSLVQNGAKVSLTTQTPNVILADLDILRKAPAVTFLAGYGDMLAKYVSICDWRLSHLLTGRYYCEAIAELVRRAVADCRKASPGAALLAKNRTLPPDAPTASPRSEAEELEWTRAIMEGLLKTGIAMSLAGVSQPASGIEHYFSHLWDMRGVEFHQRFDRHGLQCLVGTLLALDLYADLRSRRPKREKALAYVRNFDRSAWADELRSLLGSAGETLIRKEAEEKKYDSAAHAARLERILSHWDEILRIADEELPDAGALRAELKAMGAPLSVAELDVDAPEVRRCCIATKDIRDKYIVSRLLWDMGDLEDAAEKLARLSPAARTRG